MTEPIDQRARAAAVEEDAQDWFLRFVSGDASEQDLDSFLAWRDADPSHRAAYEEIRDLWNDIDGFEAAFAPTNRAAAVHNAPVRAALSTARVRRQSRQRTGFRRGGIAAGLAAACLALLVVFAGDVPTRVMADHRTGVGEQAEVRLPDGSTAYLNTDTALSIEYVDNGRHISLLRGEAWFDVAKDPRRPFFVLALGGRTTATGTAFAVRDRGEIATVTVTDGSVAVSSPASDAESRLLIAAGERVSYAKGGAPGPVGEADIVSTTAWRKGMIVIDGLPLDRAIQEIDRYLPGRVLLVADTSAFEPVTARLSLRTLNSGLEALAATHGLAVIQVAGYLTIVH